MRYLAIQGTKFERTGIDVINFVCLTFSIWRKL